MHVIDWPMGRCFGKIAPPSDDPNREIIATFRIGGKTAQASSLLKPVDLTTLAEEICDLPSSARYLSVSLDYTPGKYIFKVVLDFPDAQDGEDGTWRKTIRADSKIYAFTAEVEKKC